MGHTVCGVLLQEEPLPWRIDLVRGPDGALRVHIGLGPLALVFGGLTALDTLVSPCVVRPVVEQLVSRLSGW